MKYVLIFVITTTNGGGSSTAEFDDKAACEDALEAIAEYYDGHAGSASGM